MHKYILLSAIFIINIKGFSQLTISNGCQWAGMGNTAVTLYNIGFINNGAFTAGNGVIKFTGPSVSNIGGTSVTDFNELEIAKTGTGKVSLLANATVNSKINFTSGLLDLNQQTLTLASTAFLENENENSRITGLNGGEVFMALNMDTPTNMNPGNLGAIITSSSNLGSVRIRRGHKAQTGAGLLNSINRYFDIQPTNNNNLNATFRYSYFDAELNSQNENLLDMFRSTDNGGSWINQSYNTRNPVLNFVEGTGISAFSKWTLSSSGSGPLPVTGMEFFAKRINSTMVQLKWKTIQEINNKGFYIERRKENESNFANLDFINSNANGGNSSFPLQYQNVDINGYAGNSYYRLKQEDRNGKTTYSVIKIVKGNLAKQIGMQVWPVPAIGFFNVSIYGLVNPDRVQVVDMNGKIVKQFAAENQIPYQVKGLPSGTYYVKLASDKSVGQKVVVQ